MTAISLGYGYNKNGVTSHRNYLNEFPSFPGKRLFTNYMYLFAGGVQGGGKNRSGEQIQNGKISMMGDWR